jgi:Ca-activated chloride channel family protein
MLSVDIKPDRLSAAKETIENFIQKRTNDRLALIIYAGTAYTRIPLTLDHNLIRESLQDVDINSVNQDGTAIGMGISVAINRLKKSEAESKVIILVTDGVNNAGEIDPLTAAALARDMEIRVYTIGVGTDETLIPYQFFGQTRYQRYEAGLDEDLLMEIAERTGARYYRAEDAKELASIFTEIDRLEKSFFDRDNFQHYTELAFVFIMIALVLLLAGIFLDQYYYIRIP